MQYYVKFVHTSENNFSSKLYSEQVHKPSNKLINDNNSIYKRNKHCIDRKYYIYMKRNKCKEIKIDIN